MAATNNYLISYDISSNRTRNLLAKLLAKLGCVRWQKSVFVAIDFEKTDLEQLKTQITRLLANKTQPTDSVLLVMARDLGNKNCFLMGKYTAFDPDDTIIVWQK